MKAYYLRFTNADFIKSGKIWRTPIYDLYYNNQYKNFSLRRANYGSNLLGDGTYTGLNATSPTTSDIGFVENGRFIDTSGRIDVLGWSLEILTDSTATIATSLTAYNTDDSTAGPYYSHATPGEINDWISRGPLESGMPIYLIKAGRYAYFEINFETELSDISTLDIELIVRVEIDPPIVDGYFQATHKMLSKFPEWMDIREYDPYDPAGATPATPGSLGGKLLNSIAGEWLTNLNALIQFEQFQRFIETADQDLKSWVYVSRLVPTNVREVLGDSVVLANASSITEFYESPITADAFFYNSLTNELFTNKKYDKLYINYDASLPELEYLYEQFPYQVWNAFDDIGITVDLFRLQSATPNGYLEDNDSFKKRILDVYKNTPGIGIESFKKTLRREFNLWRYYGSTPDSDFFGATPEILDIEDIENDPTYFTSAGLPTQKFKNLIDELAKKYPMTWGFFKYDKAFWDADGIGHKGFSTLPRQLDATPVSEEYIQSGIGDGNDGYIFKPQAYTGAQSFETKLRLRGRQRTTRSEYVPLSFDVKIYGTAAEDLWDNPTLTANFTIELTVLDNSASPSTPTQNIYYALIDVSDKNIRSFYDATPSSGAFFDWTTHDGFTDLAYPFIDKYTGAVIGQVDLNDTIKIDIIPGHFNGNIATPSYVNAPTQNDYKVWFPVTPETIMGYGGSTQLTLQPYVWTTNDGSFFFQSQMTNHPAATPDSWVSDSHIYHIELNGVQPDMTIRDFTLELPSIIWPASTSARSYVVELATGSGGGVYGAYASSNSATPIFLSSAYIAVDGNATWTNGYRKTFSTSTESITFSSTTGSGYPATVNVWSLFSSTATYTVNGIVDPNGPHRGGMIPRFGNYNFLLQTLNLSRDDFSVPNTNDYIITWVGIDSISNANIISWLDANTVEPAVSDDSESGYDYSFRDVAMTESYDTGTSSYIFSPLAVYARLKPGSNEKWYPKIHSGWVHDDVDEFYIYADPYTDYATTNTKTLSGINRQGAPIIAHTNASPAIYMRQVAFFEDSATPSLSLTNSETFNGNGSNQLFAAYPDIYNITVFDKTLNESISPTSSSTNSNIIQLPSPTNRDHEYEITYQVNKSFYVDYDYSTPSTPSSNIVFDKHPSVFGAPSYKINYENSVFDLATPVDVPLSPFYTSMSEGFLYIDTDVYPLNQVEVKITPSKIMADGIDHALLTFKAYDTNGNPKPNQSFNLYTNFGILSNSSITTDKDGFAFVVLQSESWDGSINPSPATPALPAATPNGTTQGLVLIDGTVDAIVGFEIEVPTAPKGRLVAVLDSNNINADGISATHIFGVVEDGSHQPRSYADVYWRKSRNLYDLFSHTSWSTSQATPGATETSGLVIADSNGRFSIGPFVSSNIPGYWLTAVESYSASPNYTFDGVGDVVYWYECSNITNIIDPVTNLPVQTAQGATPYWTVPSYNDVHAYPTTYDENVSSLGYSGPQNVPTNLPSWYPKPAFWQYQGGFSGPDGKLPGATPRFPYYEEL